MVVMPKGGSVLLASSGWRVGMLRRIQQCTEQNPAPRRSHEVQSIASAKGKTPVRRRAWEEGGD